MTTTDDRPMLPAFTDLADEAQREHLAEHHTRKAQPFRLRTDPLVRDMIHRSDHARPMDHVHTDIG